MVRTLNVPMNDDHFAYLKQVKERSGQTWEEFLLDAAGLYEATNQDEEDYP
jgi:hypothetical protein